MRKLACFVTSSLLLLPVCRAQDVPWFPGNPQSGKNDAAAGPHIDLQVRDFRVVEISTDHITVGLHVSVRSDQHAKIGSIAFDHTYLNGLPLFLGPMEQPVEVLPNEYVQLPGEMTATVYYRDVDNSGPLEDMVQSGTAKVDGEATIKAQLNLVEKLALLSDSVTSKVPVHAVFPVALPGGDLGKSAALMALHAAQPLFGVAKKASSETGIGPTPDPWRETQKKQFDGLLLYLVTQYQLKDKHGTVTKYTHVSTGFRIDPIHFAALKEAAEPWLFDSESLSLMKSGAKVVNGATDILVYAPGDVVNGNRPALSLGNHDIRMVAEGSEDHESILMKSEKGLKKGSLDVRASKGNVAVFAFSTPAATPADPEIAQDSDALDPIAIVRFETPQTGLPLEIEAIPVSAARHGEALELTNPLDARSFGAPVVVSSGILAIVQDEHSATLLRPLLKRAGYALSH